MNVAAKLTEEDYVDGAPRPLVATPTASGIPGKLEFLTFTEALDYAATGQSGLNFYSDRLELTAALPYRELRQAALRFAHKLWGHGLSVGDRVALIADTTADFVTAFAACQYGGFIPVPMPLPVAFGGHDAYVLQLRHMMSEAGARAAIGSDWVMGWLNQAAEGLNLRFCGTMAELAAAPDAAVELPTAAPDNVSYLQFSSGSTRQPAGIAITHRALMANTSTIARSGLKIGSADRATSWLPFYHDMGLVGFLLTPIVAQMTVDYMATQVFARRPLNWLRLMSANGSTISYSPSFGYDLCAKRVSTGQPPSFDLSAWRVAGIGGDMIRPHVLRQFQEAFAPSGFNGAAFVPSYGMAETTLAISFAALGQGMRTDRVDSTELELNRRAVPAEGGEGRQREFVICGRALPGHTVEIRDDAGKLLGERQIGRIFVRGPSLMSGYDGRPEATAAVLDAQGWLDTGDLGYCIGDEIVITGRSKDLIIVNGRNLSPQDLEYSAEQVDGVRPGDVAAFSVENEEAQEEQVVLLVQCRTADPEARQGLMQAISANLRKSHGIAVLVDLVPNNSLPMTSSGKLRRSNARKAYLAGAFRPAFAQ